MQNSFVVVVRSLVRSFFISFFTFKSWRKLLSAALSQLVLMSVLPLANAATFLAFGPATYERTTGKPVTVTNSFSYPRPGDICIAHVYNGGINFTDYDRVSSAVITFNSGDLFVPSDFNQQVTHIQKPVTMAANNALAVEVRSKPGSAVVVTIECEVFDTTPPGITAIVVPPANIRGWHNSDPTVSFNCTDTESNIVFCSDPVSVITEGIGQVVEGRAEDEAGNTATASVSIHLDKTAPTLTQTVSPPANPNGWLNRDVTIQYTCTDTLSGVDSCPSPKTITAEGANQDISASIIDNAGNSATVSSILNIDKSAPSITAQLSSPPNAQGWHNTDVTITFVCNDGVSGVENCPLPITVTAEGANQTFTGSATDLAGNSASATVTLNIDKTSPVITALAAPLANANGWNNTDVTVTFNCQDTGSGIASCTSPVVVNTDGANQVIVGQVIDHAGNTATASVTINLDKTAPNVSVIKTPQMNLHGWNDTDVTVSFVCSDATSGILSCPADTYVSAEGTTINTVSAEDAAGNVATKDYGVSIDKSDPTIAARAVPAPNTAGWNNSDVTVQFECSDIVSGVASCTDPVRVTTEGENQIVTGTVTDFVSKSATASATLNIDKTPPIISISSPVNNSTIQIPNTTIEGEVTDDNALVSLVINGQTVSLNDGRFIYSATLETGINSLEIVATDIANNQSNQVITVTRTENNPPVIMSVPITSAVELTSYQYQVTAIDPDDGDQLAYGLLDAPEDMTIDAVTGAIDWYPYANDIGQYTISVAVSDLAGAQVVQTYQLNVENVPSGQFVCGPNITGFTRPTDIAVNYDNSKLFVLENVPEYLDSQQRVKNYEPIGSVSIVDSYSRQIVGQVELPMGFPMRISNDRTGSKIYVTISKFRGTTLSYGNSAIVVIDSVSNAISKVIGLPDGSGVIDIVAAKLSNRMYFADRFQSLIYVLDATNDTIINSISAYGTTTGVDLSSDESMVYTIDRYSGTLSVASTIHYSTVDQVDTTLIWSPTSADVSVASNDKFIYAANVDSNFIVIVDADVYSPTYHQQIDTIPTNAEGFLQIVVSKDGRYLYGVAQRSDLVYIIDVNPNSPAYKSVVGTFDDGSNSNSLLLKSSQFGVGYIVYGGSKSVSVLCGVGGDKNTGPTITSTPPTNAVIDVPYRYEMKVDDPDVFDELTFSFIEAPAGMTIDPQRGVIQWTPTRKADLGAHTVTVRVDDSYFYTDVQTFTINVVPPEPTSHSVCGAIDIDGIATRMVLSPDKQKLFVIESTSATDTYGGLHVIDTSTQRVTSTLGLSKGVPVSIGYSSVNDRVYVPVNDAYYSQNRIEVIDAQSETLLAPAPFPTGSGYRPSDIAFSRDGTKYYISDNSRGLIHVYNVQTDQKLSEISLYEVYGLLPSPNPDIIYAITQKSGFIYPINTLTDTKSPYIATGFGDTAPSPSWSITPDGGRIYLASTSDSRLNIIDLNRGRSAGFIETNRAGLNDVEVSPDGRIAFVATQTGEILVVDVDPASATYHTIRYSFDAGANPYDIKFSELPGAFAYVSDSTSGKVFITCHDTNRAIPVITSEPETQVVVGGIYQYQVEANDTDPTDFLIYSLDTAPAGMTIDAATGLINWQPTMDQSGAQKVTVRVTDPLGFFTTQTFTIDALLLTPSCDTIHSGGKPVDLGLTPSGSTLLVAEFPYNPDYGFMQGFLRFVDVNTSAVEDTVPLDYGFPSEIYITDDGKTAYVTISRTGTRTGVANSTVSVVDLGSRRLVNKLAFTNTAYDATDIVLVPERNRAYVTDRIDPRGVHMFTLNDGRWRGTISLSGAPDGLALTADHSRIYVVKRSSSEVSVISTPSNSVVANIPVSLSSYGGIASIAIAPNEKIALVSYGSGTGVAVIDIDPASPTYHQQLQVIPTTGSTLGEMKISNDNRLTYLASTGTNEIIVMDVNEFSPTYLQQVGTIPAGVGVDDVVFQYAAGVTAYAANFTAQNVTPICNPNPEQNAPPVIASTPYMVANVGIEYRYRVRVTDPDIYDLMSFSLEAAPEGMKVNASSGLITWIPALNQIGEHNVTVRVTDRGGVSDTQSFTVTNTYAGANEPPAFISTSSTTTVLEGEQFTYNADAIDPDNEAIPGSDPISFSLATYPTGMAIDGYSGIVSWTPAVGQAGNYPVSIRVSDSRGASVTQDFTLVVEQRPPNIIPEITSVPVFSAKSGYEYQYQLEASDANGDVLTYSLPSAPAGITISNTGLITWTPTDSVIGEHNIIARASDAQSFADQGWVLTVIDGSIAIEAVIGINPTSLAPGESATITVTANNAAGTVTRSATVDGVDVPLDVNGVGRVTLNDIGPHDVIATVSDVSGTDIANATIYVRDPNDTAAPIVDITSPQTDITVTAKMEIAGLVSDANLQRYVLAYAPADSDNFVTLAQGTSAFPEQTIATFDATMLVNGLYNIVLQATDQSGQTSSDTIQVLVDGNLKVGNFSFTVVDLEIPVSGIPIRVTRTYDSRRKHDDLDFGYGWTIGYQDVKVDESRVPSTGWALNQYPSGPLGSIPLWCIEPLGNLRVTVTLPDGDVETFKVRSENGGNECAQLNPVLDVRLKFVPEAGTLGTLTAVDDTLLRYNDNTGNLEFIGSSTPFDPNQYVYTSKQGFEYHLDQNFGIEMVKDLNGNTLTYTGNGIIHSDGKSVLFHRDALGRITTITDPMNNALHYAYDSEGNLQSYTDLENHDTTYTYVNGNAFPALAHSLLDIIDPLGRGVIKNIYDDTGRLIAQEDANGIRTEFDHNIDGRESVVTNRRGYITRYFYDDRGNVTVKVDADGATVYDYDADDNLLSTMNPRGEMSTATYDDRRNQVTQANDLGHTVTFEYNQRGQETKIYDARGNAPFVNVYDSLGNLRQVTDPLGHVATQTPNAKGLIASRVDALLGETTLTYDAAGNKLTEIDSEGHVTSFTYDANGNVKTETRQRTVNGVLVDEITTYDYDKLNRLFRTTDPLGNVSEVEYDEAGNEAARISAVGTAREQRTTFEYDAYRRLLRTTFPDNTTEQNQYDAEGNLILSIDRLNRVTQYRYDALNRQTRVIYPDGTFTQTQYDAAGRVMAETDARGNRTEHGYDRAGRRILTRNADLKETHFGYDEDGNLTSQTDAKTHTTIFEVDALDRKRKTIFHDNSEMREDYDALGRLTLKTDPSGIQTQFGYDTLGRLTTVISAHLTPRQTTTSYTYDEAGNKLTQTDANHHTTTWTYDALGRVETRSLPEGQQESFTYDENGNPKTHTDFNHHTTTYAYDNNNRLTTVTYHDGSTETYTYYANGQRETATDQRGTISYTYDDRDRLTAETQPDGTVLTYDYDEAGNRILLQTDIPNAQTGHTDTTTTEYSYDNLNRLYTVTDHHNQVTTYTYDAVGNRETVTYPNGTRTLYVYDALNRLQTLQTTNSSNHIISQFDYTLYPTGHRESMTDHNGNVSTYIYDELYRLTSETINHTILGTVVNSYTYDAVGNRESAIENGVTTTYLYDSNDRMLSSTQNGVRTTYGYDDNGSMLSKATLGDDTTFSYDARNKLITAVQSQGGSATSNVYFDYDIDGNRVQKTDNGTITNFVVDRNQSYAQVVHETNDQNATQVTYTHGDDLISQDRSASVNYYNYDGLGSTRSLTDTLGQITDTYDYNAYGTILDQSGSTNNNYLYTGEQFDASLDNYYLRARYYDPAVGRFTQMDAWMGYDIRPSSLNKYTYTESDPINGIDPSGKNLVEVLASTNIQAILVTTAIVAYAIHVNTQNSVNNVGGFDDPNVISLDEWKQRRNESLTTNGDGGGGDDDDFCKVKQEQLLSRMLMPILLTRSGLMGTWQFNQFVKKFNADVTKHNMDCPNHQVQPLSFL